MKHVPIAELKERLSEYVAAAEAGEEIVITRHGRDAARLVAPDKDSAEERRQVFADLAVLRDDMRRRGVRVTREEVKAWINEGRP